MHYTILTSFFAVFLITLYFIYENKKLKTERKDLQTDVRTLLHEIKNSLTAMRIESDNLPQDSVVISEIDRLANLANGFGDYLKDPKGQPSVVELNRFLSEICKLYGCKIKTSSEDDICVKFDKDRLRSVFENLIKNACESMDGKGSDVEVEISSEKNHAITKIMDRGTGLKAENYNDIFKPFFTTKENGSGIGLFISKKFVEAQGGTIKLYPREKKGTVAEVILPVSKK